VLDDLVGNLLDVLLDLAVGELATNQTLGSEESVLGVDDGLALGGDTDETLALLCEANDGGSCAATWGTMSAARGDGTDDASGIPSEFSMIRGTLPSMTATAELVVPRSIPMTEPLTFSSAPSA
jgi:hypothetical protein